MLPAVTLITATGSYSSPVGCKYLKVLFSGGGGGGGGGGAVGTNGSGGGAGRAGLAYYPPGTYNVVIGTGGAGGAVNTAGTSGVSTVFDSTNVYDTATGVGGQGGGVVGPQGGVGSFNVAPDFSGIVLSDIKSQPGAPVSWEVSGNGGINSLCRNGQGVYKVSTNAVGIAGVRGGGGGAGNGGVGGTGGAGGAGFVRVIAYF
jgi:hypothetical protein